MQARLLTLRLHAHICSGRQRTGAFHRARHSRSATQRKHTHSRRKRHPTRTNRLTTPTLRTTHSQPPNHLLRREQKARGHLSGRSLHQKQLTLSPHTSPIHTIRTSPPLERSTQKPSLLRSPQKEHNILIIKSLTKTYGFAPQNHTFYHAKAYVLPTNMCAFAGQKRT